MAGSVTLQRTGALRTDSLFWDADHDGTVELGDVVRLSSVSNKYVESETDNRNINPAIGVAVQLLTATRARVQTFGPCELNFTWLTDTDKRIFLDTDGTPTTTKPSTGYIQVLGHCHYSQRIFINPVIMRVKSNPF